MADCFRARRARQQKKRFSLCKSPCGRAVNYFLESHPTSPAIEDDERLTIESWELRHDTEIHPCGEVERNDLVFTDAVEVTVRSEPHSARPRKAHRRVRCEYADETACVGGVLAETRLGIAAAVGRLAGDDDVPAGRDREIERT